MDLKGSLVDTNVKIQPTEKLKTFVKTIPNTKDLPHNILQLKNLEGNSIKNFKTYKDDAISPAMLTNEDIEIIKKIQISVIKDNTDENIEKTTQSDTENETENKSKEVKGDQEPIVDESRPYLVTSDLDWLYTYIKKKRDSGEKDLPYLHVLLEGAHVDTPKNMVIKRNPELEARCVKLRAQQEARDYRKMTKGVDNVRMRFPEDSISYQMKQINRQLIAVGQFIISIFAGFLFGFRGVEWMVGNLEFGVRLLLGVMCALIIALAEIYFLAKKLNEELNIPETVQLGGPPKFVTEDSYQYKDTSDVKDKDHQD